MTVGGVTIYLLDNEAGFVFYSKTRNNKGGELR